MKKRIYLLTALISSMVTTIIIKKIFRNSITELRDTKIKLESEEILLNKWLRNIGEQKSLSEELLRLGYSKIAIYGMGDIANRIYEQLEKTSVQVVYEIDKERDVYSDVELYIIEDELLPVDAIIVADFMNYENIKNKLKSKTNCEILSIEDIVLKM